MKKIKEINLGVGADAPNYPGKSSKVHLGYNGGVLNNADSSFSRRMQVVNNEIDFDEDSSEEEMNDKKNILKHRVKRGREYQLQETLNRLQVNEITSIGDLAADLYSGGKKVLKSTLGATPYLDAFYGTYRLASVAITIKEFSDKMSTSIGQDPGYFGQALIHDDEKYWTSLLQRISIVATQNPRLRDQLTTVFNNLLETLKDFVITIVEAYDSWVAAAATAATGAGAPVAPEAGALSNVITFFGGLTARFTHVERVLFSGAATIAKGLSAIITFTFGKGKISEESLEEKNKLQKHILKLEEKGGSVLMGLLRSPLDSLTRLHELYKILDKDAGKYLEQFNNQMVAKETWKGENVETSEPAAATPEVTKTPLDKKEKLAERYSLKIFLNEEKESCSECGAIMNEDDEHTCEHIDEGLIGPMFEKEKNELDDSLPEMEEIDLEEFSSVGGGSIAGYTGPLGDEKRKNISANEYLQKEQIDWMRRMELYHQKTTNRLK